MQTFFSCEMFNNEMPHEVEPWKDDVKNRCPSERHASMVWNYWQLLECSRAQGICLQIFLDKGASELTFSSQWHNNVLQQGETIYKGFLETDLGVEAFPGHTELFGGKLGIQ